MPTVCTNHPCFHAHCVHVAALLSRMRLGGDNLTDADWALLESRVCSTKGHVKGCKKAAKGRCCKFEDAVKPARTKAGGKSRAAPKITGRLYCAIALGATVIAALREKVNAINELHIEGQRQKNIRIYESEAVDTGPMGLPVINQPVLAAVDKQARSQLRTLSMYVGMSALLTINAVRLAAARDLRVHPDSCLWRQPSSACFGSQKGEGEHQGAFGKKSQKCSAILCMGWEFLIGQVQENEGELS